MEYWIIYHVATGELLIRGSGERGSAAQQQLPDGTAIIAVPQKVVAQPEIDLAALRAACIYSVDVEAEAVRGRFLTAGSGQAMTYTRKEAEALLIESFVGEAFDAIEHEQLRDALRARANAWLTARG